MTKLKMVNLPNKTLTEEIIFKSLNAADILHEQFSITDLPNGMIGLAAALPAATAVFDLAGSSLSVRNNGAINYAADSQDLFRGLSDIIYTHGGIIEKFPGDGISMHFPAVNVSKETAIIRAYKAIKEMDSFLRDKKNMSKSQYRFTLTYGDDTIVTKFGNDRHEELISIGHAVNVAHKLEKQVKDGGYYIGMDNQCKPIIQREWNNENYQPEYMLNDLCRSGNLIEFWYGVK
ncbi:hypothetical protein [Bacillus cereus]|uniref:hypothetical protein n=1 Tax=Bacillus cereus TaxID=1396 RepID=UPI001443A261|nr:hypothetical protein [Bacillus cereus]NKX61479.1 hypothetical protein [Bacillus cereus]